MHPCRKMHRLGRAQEGQRFHWHPANYATHHPTHRAYREKHRAGARSSTENVLGRSCQANNKYRTS